jgi:hypothetical protein
MNGAQMNNVVLYCKSYRPDFPHLLKLCESVAAYNRDNLPFYISVPSRDIATLFDIIPEALLTNVYVISDDSIMDGPLPDNWLSQQLVKSSFWKVGVCENYFMLDSDTYFIRDFTVSDFMYDEDTPYTTCHEQKDLFSWSVWNSDQLGFDPRKSFIDDKLKIMNVFGRTGKCYDFGPGPIMWSVKVWQTLDETLKLNGMTFADALNICPSEFTWYGETIMSTQVIRLMPVEPVFKSFHYYQQYMDYKAMGITEEHLSQNYMGIGMQSSFPVKTIEY